MTHPHSLLVDHVSVPLGTGGWVDIEVTLETQRQSILGREEEGCATTEMSEWEGGSRVDA